MVPCKEHNAPRMSPHGNAKNFGASFKYCFPLASDVSIRNSES